MTAQHAEMQEINRIGADYRQRGYEVKVAPSGSQAPEFLRGFQPDLIAMRPGDNVVIEVKFGTHTSVAERLRDIAERVNRQDRWRLSVVFVTEKAPHAITDAEVASLQTLDRRLKNAEQLIASNQPEAAFLLLWSTAEGFMRLIGQGAGLPLTNLPASALLRELYSAGELSREDFEVLMRLLPVRNDLVHGVGVHESLDVDSLHGVVLSLAGELHEA